MARGMRAKERGEVAFQTTDLVHDAYLKLVGPGADWASKAHFFGAAANAVRQILVTAANRRDMAERKLGPRRSGVGRVAAPAQARPDTDEFFRKFLFLERALQALEAVDPPRARIASLRWHAGLSTKEIAEVLQSTPEAVERSWAAARAWIRRWMDKHGGDGDPA